MKGDNAWGAFVVCSQQTSQAYQIRTTVVRKRERECRKSGLAIGQISTHDGAHRHCQAFWFADPLAQSAFHFLELVPDDENSCLVGETIKDINFTVRI